MINYLALLGWGYDETTTFFTIPELQELFSLERVSKNPAVFDEQKLRWINGRYVRELPVDDLTARLEAFTGRTGPARTRSRSRRRRSRRSTSSGRWPARSSTVRSMTRRRARSSSSRASPARRSTDARAALADAAGAVDAETRSRRRCAASSSARGAKPKQLFQPLRVALTGTTVSPGIFETVALLGRDETLARVGHALEA